MPPRDAEARKRAAFAAANVALAASGTVSLELAAAATPMVIAYDMNWFSWQILSRMVKLDTVTLVNLVSERLVVPEFLGPNCKPAPIARALNALLDDPIQRQDQLEAMAATMAALGRGAEPPGLRAARAVLQGLAS
jgi:lipid-A-disaccharide synthase